MLALLATTFMADGSTEVLKNVQYVKDGLPDQTLDFYWPGQKPKATVLFIHGGSLNESGERRTSAVYRDICKPFVDAGFGCATMDYRLAPTHKWPAMPQDVASAILTVRQLVSSRGGDPDRLFLFGHSSGCHLAAILGTDLKYLKDVGLTPGNLAGIIAMGCVLDLHDSALRRVTADQIRQAFIRDRSSTDRYLTPEDLLGANPSYHIGPHVPPTLVLVAEQERFMPPILEQGARFVRRLLEKKIPANLVIVPGRHMSSISDIGQPDNKSFAAIRAFLENPGRVGSQ
ncbi:MAG: alpha/beta hydrolase [Blastocatellia bacterium]|nr:alpha/beta hydrolase [Blastocatellia bacterium]